MGLEQVADAVEVGALDSLLFHRDRTQVGEHLRWGGRGGGGGGEGGGGLSLHEVFFKVYLLLDVVNGESHVGISGQFSLLVET